MLAHSQWKNERFIFLLRMRLKLLQTHVMKLISQSCFDMTNYFRLIVLDGISIFLSFNLSCTKFLSNKPILLWRFVCSKQLKIYCFLFDYNNWLFLCFYFNLNYPFIKLNQTLFATVPKKWWIEQHFGPIRTKFYCDLCFWNWNQVENKLGSLWLFSGVDQNKILCWSLSSSTNFTKM